jgi:hypothetical protein
MHWAVPFTFADRWVYRDSWAEPGRLLRPSLRAVHDIENQ